MRALVWLLGLFSLAAGLAVLAEYNSAYVLIVTPPYRVQITMNLVVLLGVGGFALLYFLIRIALRTFALPATIAAWRQRKRRQDAAEALQAGSRLYLEGRYGQAYRQAEAAYEGGFAPRLAALLAAKAAQALREGEKRQLWLDRAAAHDGETDMARLMIEAEHAVADRDYDSAARLLDQMRDRGHRHIAALRLSLQTEQGRGRWDQVARIARQLRKYKALTAEQSAPLLRRALIEQLSDAQGDLEALLRLWNSIPDEDRLDSHLLQRAMPLFMAVGDQQIAVKAIEDGLAHEWDSDLAILYGRCRALDFRTQLSHCERWIVQHPKDAGLLLSLGRLCVRAQLWGKAQSYLEAPLSIIPSHAAHLELAQLAETLERPELAQRHYKAAAEIGAMQA